MSSHDIRFIDKGANDFATQADITSEEHIVAVIRRERPGDGIIAEESGILAPPDSSNGRVWLVDPLCGTVNYAAHTHEIAVNVALQNKVGQPVAAAVAHPSSAEVFWTGGTSAYIRRGGFDAMLGLRLPKLLPLVEVNFHGAEPQGKCIRLAFTHSFRERFLLRVHSTTLTVPWVAAGRRAAYITEGDLRNNVHYAAGIAVCQSAGCVVSDIEGQPLHSGIGGLLIAANEATHATILAILQAI